MIPSVTLSSGHKMPLIGLGTWRLTGKECIDTVKLALELGYRLIDTAHVYENHKEIKKAIQDFDRSKLFITTKLALDQVSDNKVKASVESAFEKALEELGLDYIDLYLLHWPDHTRPLQEILHAMHDLRMQRKIRSMGVSNFTIHHLQDALDDGIEMAVNQVEFHPFLNQQELLGFCKKHRIHVTSYRSLGKGALLEEPLFAQIAKRHKKTPAQIILRWLLQQEMSVIPKSTSKEHLKENLEVANFVLEEKEMQALSSLNRNLRYCDADWSEFNY
jgi:diketogulonate reductase-like aldo/keto reductase